MTSVVWQKRITLYTQKFCRCTYLQWTLTDNRFSSLRQYTRPRGASAKRFVWCAPFVRAHPSDGKQWHARQRASLSFWIQSSLGDAYAYIDKLYRYPIYHMICLFLRRPRAGQKSDSSFVSSFLGTIVIIIIIETSNNEKIQNFALKPTLPAYVGKPYHAGNTIIVFAIYYRSNIFI